MVSLDSNPDLHDFKYQGGRCWCPGRHPLLLFYVHRTKVLKSFAFQWHLVFLLAPGSQSSDLLPMIDLRVTMIQTWPMKHEGQFALETLGRFFFLLKIGPWKRDTLWPLGTAATCNEESFKWPAGTKREESWKVPGSMMMYLNCWIRWPRTAPAPGFLLCEIMHFPFCLGYF